MKDDKILIGQILKIPSASGPGATTPPSGSANTPTNKDKPPKSSKPENRSRAGQCQDSGLPGPRAVLGRSHRRQTGSGVQEVLFLYQSTHEDAKDDASLRAKAQASVTEVFTNYTLKAEDFRFIAPPKAETVGAKRSPVSVYEQLTASSMLAYRTPWEFVAERFHCQESYLRILNEKIADHTRDRGDVSSPQRDPF